METNAQKNQINQLNYYDFTCKTLNSLDKTTRNEIKSYVMCHKYKFEFKLKLLLLASLLEMREKLMQSMMADVLGTSEPRI